MDVKQVEIEGHSFVNHLETYNVGDGYPQVFNLGLDGTKIQTFLTGQSGGTIRRGRKTIHNLMEDISSPDCVLLQICGNDLSVMGYGNRSEFYITLLVVLTFSLIALLL